ncbi:golgi integral membrane protein [Grosmannia clavigera kw1407]|uniref:Protein BTN n=1 Tax=Grosmannia clavigera (strain kw1407 / UAMH 11150) TaxID=655863 RepID=F0X7V2_GROCL|nr:golgi integral membrane protein [Grosmannia clavigera kw1407]EFX06196.1 golgi integral membrane protein [Grosmannia clavigera kw1407]
MPRSPSSSGLLLSLLGSPASTWAMYRACIGAFFSGANISVAVSFWLFGLINNVLYVVILSAAQDLVGNLPKGVVLLADVIPSFATKLIAPYFIHRVPYAVRVPIFVALSTAGMLLIATTPPEASVAVKLIGVGLASLSSGGGELSFLGLTHYYGHLSLAAWGSGTGAAGLVGAGLYVVLTDWLGFTVRSSLLASAVLPAVLMVSYFGVLPQEPLRRGSAASLKHEACTTAKYARVSELDTVGEDDTEQVVVSASSSFAAPDLSPGATRADVSAAEESLLLHRPRTGHGQRHTIFFAKIRRARALFFPYMLPLLLVYVAEYTINQGVSPTLLFPLDRSPFDEYRAFYPFYGFLYQLGVFISRSSTPFYRVHHLYIPAVIQVVNLVVLTAQALYFDSFLPSVYLVFLIVFWEGLLGGAVYVNTFAEIMEHVPMEDREFSLGATSVSDSGGICIAGFIGMAMEVGLCNWQVQHGRNWCHEFERSNV